MQKWNDIPELPDEAVKLLDNTKEYISSLLLRLNRRRPKRSELINSTLDYLRTVQGLEWALYGSYAWNRYLPIWMHTQPSDADVYISSMTSPKQLSKLVENIFSFLPIVYEGFKFTQRSSVNNGESTVVLFCEEIHFMDLTLYDLSIHPPLEIEVALDGNRFVSLAHLLRNLQYVLSLPAAKYRQPKDLAQLAKIYYADQFSLLTSQSTLNHKQVLDLVMLHKDQMLETTFLSEHQLDTVRAAQTLREQLDAELLAKKNVEIELENLKQSLSRKQSNFDKTKNRLERKIASQSEQIQQLTVERGELQRTISKAEQEYHLDSVRQAEQLALINVKNAKLQSELEVLHSTAPKPLSNSSTPSKSSQPVKKKRSPKVARPTPSLDFKFELENLQINYAQAKEIIQTKDLMIRSLNDELESQKRTQTSLAGTLRLLLAEKSELTSTLDQERRQVEIRTKRMENSLSEMKVMLYQAQFESTIRFERETGLVSIDKYGFCIERISFAYATLLFNSQVFIAGHAPFNSAAVREYAVTSHYSPYCKSCQAYQDSLPAGHEQNFVICAQGNGMEDYLPFESYLNMSMKKLRLVIPSRRFTATEIINSMGSLMFIPLYPANSEQLREMHHGGYRLTLCIENELEEDANEALSSQFGICQDCLLHNIFHTSALTSQHDKDHYDFGSYKAKLNSLTFAQEDNLIAENMEFTTEQFDTNPDDIL